jgi:hypothetical protein
MRALERLVCWALGHLENSETISEWVFSPRANTTIRVEHTSLTCDRCGRFLSDDV